MVLCIVYEYPSFRSKSKRKRFFKENYVLHKQSDAWIQNLGGKSALEFYIFKFSVIM